MRRVWPLVVVLSGPAGCGDRADSSESAKAAPETKTKAKAAAEPEPEPAPKAEHPRFIEPLGEPSKPDPIEVELPPAPAFGDASVPDRWPDGAFSIAGLRKDLEANLRDGEAGTQIIVRGWVSKIYVPPECPEGEVCPPAKQPHLWISDTKGNHRPRLDLLVANYAFVIPEWDAQTWKDQPVPVFEVGTQYTIMGKFRRFSDTGFAHDQGLLEFVGVHPRSPSTGAEDTSVWVYPPGAPWHPLQIQAQEQAEAALREKAGR